MDYRSGAVRSLLNTGRFDAVDPELVALSLGIQRLAVAAVQAKA